MDNNNSFRIIGRYIHKYEDTEDHYIILISMTFSKNKEKSNFIEVDIFDKDLIAVINNLNQNDLVGIVGHMESEVCTLNDNFKFMNKLLVADKLITKGN